MENNNAQNPTLIPKPKTTYGNSQDNTITYLAVFILVVIVGGYIALSFINKGLKTQACKIEGCTFASEKEAKSKINLAKIQDDRKASTDKTYTIKGDLQQYEEEYAGNKREVLEFKKKLDGFLLITKNRKELSQIFNFLERNTLEKVQFKGFIAKADDATLSLNGVVHGDDFLTLARQFLLLEKDKDVASVSLTNISLTKEREVEFAFNVVLKPDVYKFLLK
jgi:hypothetical protein